MLVAQRELVSRHMTAHRTVHSDDDISDDELRTRLTSRLIIYTSDQTHSSLKKACMILSIPDTRCRVIPTSAATHYTLPVDALRTQIAADLAEGLLPCFCCITFGTTGTGAVDDVSAIAAVCKQHDVYVHVDGAWAGVAWILEEYREMLHGKDGKALENVDSLCFNPHKWYGTMHGCACAHAACTTHVVGSCVAVHVIHTRHVPCHVAVSRMMVNFDVSQCWWLVV